MYEVINPVVIDIFKFFFNQKIENKHITNSEFTTLQKMITWELEANEQHLSNSVAVAVLWMKRYVIKNSIASQTELICCYFQHYLSKPALNYRDGTL